MCHATALSIRRGWPICDKFSGTGHVWCSCGHRRECHESKLCPCGLGDNAATPCDSFNSGGDNPYCRSCDHKRECHAKEAKP